MENNDFYMFGEVASRVSEVFNHGVPQNFTTILYLERNKKIMVGIMIQ